VCQGGPAVPPSPPNRKIYFQTKRIKGRNNIKKYIIKKRKKEGK